MEPSLFIFCLKWSIFLIVSFSLLFIIWIILTWVRNKLNLERIRSKLSPNTLIIGFLDNNNSNDIPAFAKTTFNPATCAAISAFKKLESDIGKTFQFTVFVNTAELLESSFAPDEMSAFEKYCGVDINELNIETLHKNQTTFSSLVQAIRNSPVDYLIDLTGNPATCFILKLLHPNIRIVSYFQHPFRLRKFIDSIFGNFCWILTE